MPSPLEYGLFGPWLSGGGGRGRNVSPSAPSAPSLSGLADKGGENTAGKTGGVVDPSYSSWQSDAMKNAMKSSLVSAGATGAVKGLAGLLSGVPMTVGDVITAGVNPASAAGLAGGILNAGLGIPSSFGQKAFGFAAPVVGSILGGPVGGLLAGALSGIAYDKALDSLDMRDNEDTLDAYGEKFGELRDRQVERTMVDFAKSLQSPVASLALAEQVTGRALSPVKQQAQWAAGFAENAFSPTRSFVAARDAAEKKAAADKAAHDALVGRLAAEVMAGTYGLGGGGYNSISGMSDRDVAAAVDGIARGLTGGGGSGSGAGGGSSSASGSVRGAMGSSGMRGL